MRGSTIIPKERQRANIYYIVVAVFSSLTIWFIFKFFYPHPFITIDSYYYIEAAYENSNVGSWPIGYSKFIRWVGIISHSGTLLVTIQYIIIQASLVYFFLTIRTIFQLYKIESLILFIFLLFNPLFLYGSNHIMSDLLFCSLSLCWVCQLLWILKAPKPILLITQAILLTAIFTIRYTALFYPIFTICTFSFSRQSILRKIIGIFISFFLLATFIEFTRVKMEEIGGIKQFSSAAGWKQASNALYMYDHLAGTDINSVPERFKLLHQLTQKYFKGPHTQVDLYHIDQEFTTGSFYVAAYESPLMQYLRIKKGENADIFSFNNIVPFGPLFNAYGNYLILHHPLSYLKYVVLPNIIAYIFPFPEIYGMPNDLNYLWSNKLGIIAKEWFGLSNIAIPEVLINIRGNILRPYPAFFSIIHIAFFISIITFIFFKCYKTLGQTINYGLTLIILISVTNFIFTVLSAASVLRFQFTFVILEFTISLYLLKVIYKQEIDYAH